MGALLRMAVHRSTFGMHLPRTYGAPDAAVITQDFVRTLKPRQKPYEVRDPRLKGFLLRVQPTGVMTYYAEYGRGKGIGSGGPMP